MGERSVLEHFGQCCSDSDADKGDEGVGNGFVHGLSPPVGQYREAMGPGGGGQRPAAMERIERAN